MGRKSPAIPPAPPCAEPPGWPAMACAVLIIKPNISSSLPFINEGLFKFQKSILCYCRTDFSYQIKVKMQVMNCSEDRHKNFVAHEHVPYIGHRIVPTCVTAAIGIRRVRLVSKAGVFYI